ncbi:acyl-CoA N-acyltransferase [Aureobasidium sp. EXF-10727]|nr:acyl-CoA N-acyltransferase [Aureobasidium sp. EXF-10727]
MVSSTQEPIVTERLILRQIRPSDSDAVFAFMSLASVMRYTSRAPLTQVHQATTYLSERTEGPNIYNFAVCLKDPTNTVIGLLGSPSYPEIGYLFSPAHAGKGYATEALLAFTPALFAVMPMEQTFAEAHVDPENVASLKLLERCGWQRWGGVEERAYTSPLLGLRDSVCYRIAREGYGLEDLTGKEEEEAFVPDLQ